jgi:hypothetical protein
MTVLARSAYEKAVNYLNHQARPLERASYAHLFRAAPAADALAELAHFQNEDGGFGHAMEPDIRLGDSSVIATTLAFQRFRAFNTPPQHPLVVKTCRYLLNTYDAAHLNWPIIPPNIDDAPHAPWWVHNGDLEKSMSNPRAEIAGYLHQYREHFPDDMRKQVTQSVVDYLLQQPDEMEMHDLLCYIRLSETPSLPEQFRAPLLDKLKRIVNNTVARSPEQWKAYGLPPLAVISSPDSPFADAFQNEIPQNLDFIIASQGENGAWEPNWSWGDLWPDAWEQARRDWAGCLTLDNLGKLRAFNRLA